MSQRLGEPNGSIPIPIEPRRKAAVLITIILLDILQITFGGLTLPLIYRHSGYGRRGAWARPWNEDRVPGVAIFNGVISLLAFGGNGLSELHPRHACYSRRGISMAAVLVIWFNWISLVDAVKFAWHFLSFGMEGDRDAYWLGVWGVCIASVIAAGLVATVIYLILLGAAVKREENEANVAEMSEAGTLHGSDIGTHLQTSGRTDAEVG